MPAPLSTAVFLFSAIGLGGFVGLMSSSSTETFSLSIDITLLILIFLLFFELRLGDLFKDFRNLRFLTLAWVANFLVIPLIGVWVASLFFSGQPVLFAGLMIYFLAPCTDWFLGFTRLAKGDTQLGAVLIPLNIISQLALFPLWLWLFANETGLVNFSAMPSVLLQWFAVPLFAAQLVRFAVQRSLPEDSQASVMSAASRCVPFALAVFIFQIFATHTGSIAGDLRIVTLVALAVCFFAIAAFVAGRSLSRFSGLDYPQQTLLSMTMAARNAPLMLALVAVAIPDQPLLILVIVSGMLVEIPLLIFLKQIILKRSPER